MVELIWILSESSEFRHIRPKMEERKYLSWLNGWIRFPSPAKSISNYSLKVYVMIQSILGTIDNEINSIKLDYQLVHEVRSIC